MSPPSERNSPPHACRWAMNVCLGRWLLLLLQDVLIQVIVAELAGGVELGYQLAEFD